MPAALEADLKAWDHNVDQRIEHIVQGLDKAIEFSENDVPGLQSLLEDYLNPDVKVDSVDYLRRLLTVFKDSPVDEAYSHMLDALTEDEKDRVERFLEGEKPENLGDDFVMGPSLGCREEAARMAEADCVFHVEESGVKMVSKRTSPVAPTALMATSVVKNNLTTYLEDETANLRGVGIKVYYNSKFENWGRTVTNCPTYTFVPSKVQHIQLIIEFARLHDMTVRCSGFRHSWSPVFSENGQVLISLLDLPVVSRLPNTTALPLAESAPNELETIEMVSTTPNERGNYLVKVGAACTNERLRRWCIRNDKVTLPLNVIMVEITLGGSNGPICHGAGRRHQTLSDLVTCIDYVDCHGNPQQVSKPEHLRAASGCFGLMGVITHLTLEMSPMSYAMVDPQKVNVALAVPPPPTMDIARIPEVLAKPWIALSAAEKKKCQADFENHATNDFYSEWFWFPYADQVWVNCWNNTTRKPATVNDYPSKTKIFVSWMQTVFANVVQYSKIPNMIVDNTIPEAFVTISSRLAMWSLPTEPTVAYLPDALHFQRCIQNVRVRDLEVEMPLVAKKGQSGKEAVIDYTPVQEAWWNAILVAYQDENRKVCPMRMPLEMRIMGGSNVIMAPQRGNDLGTCAIEVLTYESESDKWPAFAQQVLDKWMAIKDPNTGLPLRVRPHWAKEWKNLNVNGKPWIEKMKNEDYKDAIPEFLEVMAEIGKEAGWTLSDLKERFSNELLDEIFLDGPTAKQMHTDAVKQGLKRSADKISDVQTTVEEIIV